MFFSSPPIMQSMGNCVGLQLCTSTPSWSISHNAFLGYFVFVFIVLEPVMWSHQICALIHNSLLELEEFAESLVI